MNGLSLPQPLYRDGDSWAWQAGSTTAQSDRDLPRITLITPTLNRGRSLEETIRSVLLQGYPNLEYFVNDGGSDDETLRVLEHYSAFLTAWCSKPDRGQSHALNDGLGRATGDLLGWINSDDILLPGALQALAARHQRDPGSILLGSVINEDLGRGWRWQVRQLNVSQHTMSEPWAHAVTWHQPGTYFPRSVYERAGPLREDFHLLFDWEWMCRALKFAESAYVNQAVAAFRLHSGAKTACLGQTWEDEKRRMLRLHAPEHLRAAPRRLEEVTLFSLAQDCWALHNRQRKTGWRYFARALRAEPRLLLYPRAWVTALKSLLPLRLHARLRYMLQGH